MQDLRVSLVQLDQIWENREANFAKYDSIFQKLVSVDLILLPEMFQTGFSMNVDELAEDWNNSSSINYLKNWSSNLNAAIYTSLIIKENSTYYNRGVFVKPDGTIAIYDKRKSFGLGGENLYFTAGKDESIVEYLGWKINLQICYDLRFPEISRNYLMGNEPKFDVLLYIANWPSKRSHHWKSLLTARAIENQAYVIGVNRYGEDKNGLSYSGDSMIVDALGNVECCLEFESVYNSTLIFVKLNEIRTNLPFLKDY
jgi:predicted amidohydrolase